MGRSNITIFVVRSKGKEIQVCFWFLKPHADLVEQELKPCSQYLQYLSEITLRLPILVALGIHLCSKAFPHRNTADRSKISHPILQSLTTSWILDFVVN